MVNWKITYVDLGKNTISTAPMSFIVQDEEYYTLTINVEGSGSVTKEPDQTTYPTGTPVLLTAEADPGWSFDHWSDGLTGSENPQTISMDGDKTVTAHFTQNQYELTIQIEGSGTVTKDPDQPTYPYGTPVELQAIPEPGWSFSFWSIDLTGGDNPDTIFMDSDKTVTAHFEPDSPPISPDLSQMTSGSQLMMHTAFSAEFATDYTITLTIRDQLGEPMQGIPATEFSFTATLGDDTISVKPINDYLSYTPLASETNFNGQLSFTIRCLTAITGQTIEPTPDGGYITITATVLDVQLTDTENILVNSCDLDASGEINLNDFAAFAGDFGLFIQRGDFDCSGGSVDLSDFAAFAVEYGMTQY